MDPRVAWVQPELKGPANAFWMHIWETSLGLRTTDTLHSPCLYPAMALGSVKTNSSSCISPHPVQVSPSFILSPPFDHWNQTALNGTYTRVGEPSASPQNGSLSPLSSSLDSESDSPKSDSCDSTNTHHPHPRLFFSFSERLHNVNDCLHQHHVHLHAHLHQYHHHRHLSQQCPQAPDHNYHPVRKKDESKASTNGVNYLLSTSNGNLLWTGMPWKTGRYSPGVNG